MPPSIVAVIFGALALVVGWAIRKDLSTGVSGDSPYRSNVAENPVGYSLMILTKAAVVVFGVAEILHAFGMIEDPIRIIQAAFLFVQKRS